MNKLLLLLVGLVQFSYQDQIQLEPLHPLNFVKSEVPLTFIKSVIQELRGGRVKSSHIEFCDCDIDYDPLFAFD